MAQEVLTHLKEHPDAWTRVDTILEFSQNMNTKVSQVPTYSGGGSWFLYFEEDLISYHILYRNKIWFSFPSNQKDCLNQQIHIFLSVLGLLSIMSETDSSVHMWDHIFLHLSSQSCLGQAKSQLKLVCEDPLLTVKYLSTFICTAVRGVLMTDCLRSGYIKHLIHVIQVLSHGFLF